MYSVTVVVKLDCMSQLPELKQQDSGPVVIHVSSPIRDIPERNNNNTMNSSNNAMGRRKRRSRPLVLVVGFLVLLVAFTIFLESHGELQKATPNGVSQTTHKNIPSKNSKRCNPTMPLSRLILNHSDNL